MKDIFAESLENLREFGKNKDEYGSIRFVEVVNGRTHQIEVALTQDPYIDGPANGTPVFKAHGIDGGGNEYEIEWEVVENWEELAEQGDDQALVEDWDMPSSVEKI